MGSEITIIVIASGEAMHIEERVTTGNDESRGGKVPFEQVEFGGEGIGEDEVVVDELAIRATRAIRDTPAKGFGGTWENLANAAAVLEADFVSMGMVAEATDLDDGEEAPAKLGFFGLGEFDGDDTGREGTIQKGPEAFANAGGIDYDVLGMPGFGQVLEFAENGQVVFADPTVAGDDMIGGVTEGFEGGEIDPDDGDGGGIAAGVTEAEVGGVEGVHPGFVHASDVEEEGHRPFDYGSRYAGRAPATRPSAQDGDLQIL